MSEPSVSPADTIRRNVVHSSTRILPDYRCPPECKACAVEAALAALLAELAGLRIEISEWVKAIHEAFDGREVDPQSDGPERIRRLVAERERDGRQIAQLTEALAFYADPVSYKNATPRTVRPVIEDQGSRARAAVRAAGEGDTANG